MIAERINNKTKDERISEKLKNIKQEAPEPSEIEGVANRTPYFCSGCPHNTSTKLPAGSKAMAGKKWRTLHY